MSDNALTEHNILYYLCPYSAVLTLAFSIATLFFLVSILLAVVIPPTDSSHFVAIMSVVVDGFVMLVTGTILYYCRQYRFGE